MLTRLKSVKCKIINIYIEFNEQIKIKLLGDSIHKNLSRRTCIEECLVCKATFLLVTLQHLKKKINIRINLEILIEILNQNTSFCCPQTFPSPQPKIRSRNVTSCAFTVQSHLRSATVHLHGVIRAIQITQSTI